MMELGPPRQLGALLQANHRRSVPPTISGHIEAEVDFYPHDRDFAKASLAPWTHPHHVKPVKCPLTTIDELTRDLQRLDLVKIDAEGAELAVWQGMQETLRRFQDAAVVIELHLDRAAAEVHELLGELQRAGKAIRRMAYDGRLVLMSGQEIHQAAGQHWTLWVQAYGCRSPRILAFNPTLSSRDVGW